MRLVAVVLAVVVTACSTTSSAPPSAAKPGPDQNPWRPCDPELGDRACAVLEGPDIIYCDADAGVCVEYIDWDAMMPCPFKTDAGACTEDAAAAAEW